jgi:ERCC4-type nuclease
MFSDPFTIIVDTREQKPWSFAGHATAHSKLDTGDYSIQGLENILAIERKRNVAEIANNITEKRFKDVIDRLSKIKYSYLLLEFDMQDIMTYPIGSDIPRRLWSKIRISPAYILKHLVDLQVDHNIKILLCGSASNAEKIAFSLMRKIYNENKDLIPKDSEDPHV